MNIACGNCGTTFQVNPVKPGSNVLCPQCNTTLAIAPAAPQVFGVAPSAAGAASGDAPVKAAKRPKAAAAAKRKVPPQISTIKVEKAHRTLKAVLVGAVALLLLSLVGVAVGAVVDDSARTAGVDRKELMAQLKTGKNTPVADQGEKLALAKDGQNAANTDQGETAGTNETPGDNGQETNNNNTPNDVTQPGATETPPQEKGGGKDSPITLPGDVGKKPTTQQGDKTPPQIKLPGDKTPEIKLPGDKTPGKEGTTDKKPEDKTNPVNPGNDGPGRITGGGGGLTVEFMGVKSTAPVIRPPNICIIADRSGSMCYGKVIWDFPKQIEVRGGKSNMEILQEELIKTLKNLPKGSKFSIIFYDDKLTLMPGVNGWQTAKDVPKAIEWVKTMTPDGETEPIPAFEEAFKLNPPPDIIFFMTDGVIDGKSPGKTLAAIERLNTKWVDVTDDKGKPVYDKKTNKKLQRRSVIINAIQMQVPEFDLVSLLLSRYEGQKPIFIPQGIPQLIAREKLIDQRGKYSNQQALQAQFYQMQAIAARNGGEFRYIPYARTGAALFNQKQGGFQK